MTKRISSSDWTGPTDKTSHRGAFTHGLGQHSIASDYQRILEGQRAAAAIPPEVWAVRRRAILLLLSPLALWVAWLLVGFVTRDAMVRDQSHVLVLWGLGAMALGAWQLHSRSTVLIGLRRAFLIAWFAATAVIAGGYAYFGIESHSRATASAPERSFELYKVRGKRPFRRVISWHQRADGSTLEGINQRQPLQYARVCALVQRLDGPYRFSWVRVLDRSRPPGPGQLTWPVRREDCFSEVPLSSLPR